ncbi:hypothetical protein I4F81_004951 [Pyropia yezoensis]|uniref:Uncharacterized protein n=1 Tax=Pyropia yezoensis TaxID=2788 RepID=A0ACC3BXW5_PYRYE|nr:hypothetical protein I4F81_004951 [Neopyropia yezoensis]
MSERAPAEAPAPEPTAAVTARLAATTLEPTAAGEATPPATDTGGMAAPQVSREKRPLNFFIGLAKKFLVNEEEVELSGLGLAVTTVVTVAEILKSSGYVDIVRIETSLVDMREEGRSTLPKAKIQIWIRKSDQSRRAAQLQGGVDHSTVARRASQCVVAEG